MLGDLCEPWPVQWCEDLTGVSPDVTGFSLEAASEYLWEATGRRFGTCQVQIRPCRRSCLGGYDTGLSWWDSSHWSYPTAVLHGGTWFNIGCNCYGDCSCTTVSEISLPEVASEIVDVSIDGESLPASGYVLYDGMRLVRVNAQWPLCQDWNVTGGPGSWVVTANFGEPVPTLGELAVGILASEFAKACTPGQECQLPHQVVNVVRQGVSFSIADLDSLLEDGLTGLTIPDMFIRRYNREMIQDRAHVIPMDSMRARVQGV